MEKTIFDFKDYKQYLRERIASYPKKGRGMRSALATAIRCQPAYLSQVLNGNADISLDQADAINTFLGHNKEEGRFCLLLVQAARAASHSLKQHLREQMQEVIDSRLVLKNRLNIKQTLSLENQATYYSAWYYAAIHVILTIPELQTRDAIAKHLNLPLVKVTQVLDFLESVNLAQKHRDRYTVGEARLHLGHDSSLISKHHANWRLKSLQSLEKDSSADLHYSSVVTISREDTLAIKGELIKTIEGLKKTIRASNSESIHCLSLDFFELT